MLRKSCCCESYIRSVFFFCLLFVRMLVCLFFLSLGVTQPLLIQFKIERFRSDGRHPCRFIETKGNVCIGKEFNSHSVGFMHQHGRHFLVLEHQYGCRDVTWKRSMDVCSNDRKRKAVKVKLIYLQRVILNDDDVAKNLNWQKSSYLTFYMTRQKSITSSPKKSEL